VCVRSVVAQGLDRLRGWTGQQSNWSPFNPCSLHPSLPSSMAGATVSQASVQGISRVLPSPSHPLALQTVSISSRRCSSYHPPPLPYLQEHTCLGEKANGCRSDHQECKSIHAKCRVSKSAHARSCKPADSQGLCKVVETTPPRNVPESDHLV